MSTRNTAYFSWTLDALLLCLLSAILIQPLFKVAYLDKWGSSESAILAQARFLKDHWPHPRWQPLWYGGTRFDYVMPPAVPYATAFASQLLGLPPVRAYRLYTASLYCLGIAGVYLLTRTLCGARAPGLLAATAAALLSPSFLFFPEIRKDAWLLVPQRLGALVRYGDGLHATAFALLPIALAACHFALTRAKLWPVPLAAGACALVFAHELYAGLLLLLLFAVLAWSLWITNPQDRIWKRAALIIAITYGLGAFWMTPSYMQTMFANRVFVSSPGSKWALWVSLAVADAYLLITDRWARGLRERAYEVFLCGAFLLLAVLVWGGYLLNYRLLGNPERWIPELDLVVILAAVEVLRRTWSWGRGGQVSATLLVMISFASAGQYVRRAWHVFPAEPDFRQRVEYLIPEWMSRNAPNVRAMVSGSVRYWYDVWHDLPQTAGAAEQSVLNPRMIAAQSQVRLAPTAEAALPLLEAMGAQVIVVHEGRSQEVFHDVVKPGKFAGRLPVLYDNQRGDIVYGVSKAPDITWEGSDVFRTSSPQAIKVNYDPAWRAYSGGRSLRIRKDPLGFMLIDAPPESGEIRVQFELTPEAILGRAISAVTLLAALWLTIREVSG